MAYQKLRVSPNAPQRVKEYIERCWLDRWFYEAHWLLSRETEPKSDAVSVPFQYVTILFLLEVVGGISEVFYNHPNQRPGDRFKAVLAKYYPWDLEPPGCADVTSGPRFLYEAFRNPFAHELGIPNKQSGGMGFMAMSFSEVDLEILEQSLTRPPLADRTLDVYPYGRLSLHIPGFYWGLRAMVYRLTDDTAMMTKIIPTLR